MKSKNSFVILVLGLIFAFCFYTADACSCIHLETCQYFAGAKVVFVGKVLDSTEADVKVKERVQPIGGEPEELERVERRQTSRVSVEESFVGTGDRKEFLIETELSSSCGFSLQKDVTYLFYAYPVQDGKYTVHYCSGTKTIAEAQADLDYLRVNKDYNASISGNVLFGRYGTGGSEPLKKYGVKTVTLSNEETQLQTNIEPDGAFKFSSVPKGKYKIAVELPDFLTLLKPNNYWNEDESQIEISAYGCYKKAFYVQENGRLSGRITNAEGEPVRDLTVYLSPVEKPGQPVKDEELCYDAGLCLSTDEDGKYFFSGLKPGKYLVGVRLGKYLDSQSVDAGYKKAFYPGTADEKKSVPVTVKFGKQTENIDFKLTQIYPSREIKGRVFFSDGRPAPKVRVRFVVRTPDLKSNWITFIKTDEEGYFSIKGYENHSYLIGAFTDERDGNPPLQAFASSIDVLPKKPLREIKLVLDQEGFKECAKCGNYDEFIKAKPVKK